MSKYNFGEISGYPVGSTFAGRKEAMYAGLHVNWVKGISGNRHEGCDAICLNGGYDTDEDYGHEVFYTGSGGQNPSTKKAERDQDLGDSDNAALVMSEETGQPIRILRGPRGEPDTSPSAGYRYDGLYKVVSHYPHVPADGHRRWLFHLVQLTSEEADAFIPNENKAANAVAFNNLGLGSGPVGNVDEFDPAATDPYGADKTVEFSVPAGNSDPGIKVVVQQRVIRDTKVSKSVKSLYDGKCQVCSIQLETPAGNYAEGAHIRPLGKPHHGPDTFDNILCLCPNHHVLFDRGGMYIDDDLVAHKQNGGVIGPLEVDPQHEVDLNHVRYHRSHHSIGPEAVDALVGRLLEGYSS